MSLLRRLARLPSSPLGRAALGLPILAAVVGVFWWRGPTIASGIGNAFSSVKWQWVVLAIGLNLASVVVRALAWTTVIRNAMPPPHPKARLVFSAFSVGLFANAVLPGRIGELARVAVLTRRLPGRKGAWATLVGTVFAHRVFDIVPVVLLILYVVLTASIPTYARSSLLAVIAVGVGLFVFAFVTARRHHLISLDGLGPLRRLLATGRAGLGVMRSPVGSAGAISRSSARKRVRLHDCRHGARRSPADRDPARHPRPLPELRPRPSAAPLSQSGRSLRRVRRGLRPSAR